MAITQLSAFLENTPGTLDRALAAVTGAGVNIRALTVADTKDFGILRMIVSDTGKAKEALKGYTTVAETAVTAAKMSDEAGSLQKILDVLREEDVNIEYIYAFTASVEGSAYVVLRTASVSKAEKCLAENGVETLTDEDLKEYLRA